MTPEDIRLLKDMKERVVPFREGRNPRRITMIALSEKWAPVLLSQPETGMNYQIASVTLKDGRKFHKVFITGGYITKFGDSETIPFEANDIDNIIVDHGR